MKNLIHYEAQVIMKRKADFKGQGNSHLLNNLIIGEKYFKAS